MKRWIVSALLALLVACCALAADDPGSAARQLGADGNKKASAAASADPSTYPGYQGADVPQRGYYHSGTQIETQARTAAPDSTAGTVVTTQVLSGPQFSFQKSDPLLQNTANAQSAGTSLLTQHYQGCVALDQTTTLCGSDLYCQGGSCTSDVVAPAPSDVTQMAAASTWLQAAQQAGLDNTNANGTFSFFAGDGMQCSKEALGFSNCCSDSGWGNDAGLAQCSEEEQQLGLAREAKRTHYVGNYETGSIFTTTHESYCVFTGLLSRLIQEQGRAQLGIGWGSARNPDCRALTPDEMSRLDLNAMDFSEFYAQAQAQANAGLAARETNAAIQQRLQQQIDAIAGGAAK